LRIRCLGAPTAAPLPGRSIRSGQQKIIPSWAPSKAAGSPRPRGRAPPGHRRSNADPRKTRDCDLDSSSVMRSMLLCRSRSNPSHGLPRTASREPLDMHSHLVPDQDIYSTESPLSSSYMNCKGPESNPCLLHSSSQMDAASHCQGPFAAERTFRSPWLQKPQLPQCVS